MARSVWKGPFVDGYLLNKAEASRASGRNEIIKIWSRRSTILPQFVGLTFGVYNGHKFLPVQVMTSLVARWAGESRSKDGPTFSYLTATRLPRIMCDSATLSQGERFHAEVAGGGDL